MSVNEIDLKGEDNNWKVMLKQYCFNHILSILWVCLLFIGGVVCIRYYVYIEYMPELNLESSFALLIAISVISIVSIFFLALSLVLPGVMFSIVLNENKSLARQFCYKKSSIITSRVFILFAVFAISPMFLIYSISEKDMLLISIFSFVMLLGTVVLVYTSGLKKWDLVGALIEFGVATFIAVCGLILVIFLAIFLFSRVQEGGESLQLAMTMLAVIFITLFNVGVIIPKLNKSLAIRASFSGGLGLAILMVFSSTSQIIPQRVMSSLKFGHYHVDKIVFKKPICDLLDEYGVENTRTQEQCIAESIFVLSSLGKNLYLQAEKSNEQSSGKVTLFEVPVTDVKSWGNILKPCYKHKFPQCYNE